jgi:hypothetical protein
MLRLVNLLRFHEKSLVYLCVNLLPVCFYQVADPQPDPDGSYIFEFLYPDLIKSLFQKRIRIQVLNMH